MKKKYATIIITALHLIATRNGRDGKEGERLKPENPFKF